MSTVAKRLASFVRRSARRVNILDRGQVQRVLLPNPDEMTEEDLMPLRVSQVTTCCTSLADAIASLRAERVIRPVADSPTDPNMRIFELV